MPPKNKGKARADPTERTPLIGGSDDRASVHSSRGSATPSSYTIETPAEGYVESRSNRYTVLFCVLSILLGVTVFIGLLGISFVPSYPEQQRMHEAFVYKDPKVDILNVSEDGVHINLTLRGGVDVDRALAVDGSRGKGIWESLRRSVAHGVLGVLPTQAVYVTIPEVWVQARASGLPLLNVTIPGDLVVPLTRNGALVDLAVEAVAHPIAPTSQLWDWSMQTWANGTIDVVVGAQEAHASIPGAWWSKWAVFTQTDVVVPLEMPVPAVPNLPPPGKPLDLSKLVALKSYSFSSDRGFKISASASLPNPSLKNVPCALPFAIQIGPNHDTIAQVVASASTITTHRIGIQIEGDIVDLESGDALSSFLQNFLQGIDNPITVRGMSSMPGDYSGPNAPPPWVLRSLPSLELGLVFPAPTDQPDIIRSVTIEKMNLGEENGNIVASGTVVALVQLPDEMKQLSLNISAIRPDIMVHNGPVSGNDEYDPDHPPPRAFGRIAPDYFLNATTAVDPNTPGVLVIRAPFENLLLNVLDGRDNVLRDFVSQVIFKGGATAGIAGITDVQADVGVGGVLAVNGLPVQGEFFVGRNLMPMEYIGEFTRNRIAQLAGGASH